ncbi:hypothetical protein ACX12M_17145 [Cellulosimicrobium cellulans]|uniref:hypothetical protein n=1 Tax=Cellulosimicrobium cellulans TaxID=1710 RepID=UPI00214A2312|nr:hypothetical protein [Cellulosimicrobium cellulans]
MAKVTLTPDLIERAMHSPAVLRALDAKARRVQPRAQRVAAQAGAVAFGRALRTTRGTRPGTKAQGGVKRPYARVEATVTDEMKAADARAVLSRTQILRRAARA